MSARDDIAAAVLPTIIQSAVMFQAAQDLARYQCGERHGLTLSEVVSRYAYRIADDMIKEGEKP